MKITLIYPNLGRHEDRGFRDRAAMEPLGLGVLAGNQGVANAINEWGEAVGYSTYSGPGFHAVMWILTTPEEQVTKLIEYVESLSSAGNLPLAVSLALVNMLERFKVHLAAGRMEAALAKIVKFTHFVELLGEKEYLKKEIIALLTARARTIMGQLDT